MTKLKLYIRLKLKVTKWLEWLTQQEIK
jgi:hypothetical protein